MSTPRTTIRTDYPAVLKNRLGVAAPAQLYAIGNASVLQKNLLGLICSIKCPGSIILKTFDTVHAALKRNQPVFTFDVEDNAALLEAGAQPFEHLSEQEGIRFTE
jgi:hypothetical protein